MRRKALIGYAVTTALVLILGVTGVVFLSSVLHRFERLSGDQTHDVVLAERLRTVAAVLAAENRTALLVSASAGTVMVPARLKGVASADVGAKRF